MTQLLIVDDEPLAVRSVLNAVDWDSLGVSRVFTAYGANQAKEIFAGEAIDVMLCDIEMPQESGLNLLAWVREHHPATESIFLTCHADFSFAQQAIQLGSLDYLLKPIPPEELESVIRKAVRQISAKHEIKQESESWRKHHPLFIERFWTDIFRRSIPSNPAAIKAAAEERKIGLPADMQVLPLLIQVRRWHKPLSLRDEKIMEYALINTLQEMIQGAGTLAGVVPVERGQLLAILSGLKEDAAALKRIMESYIASCRKFFFCDMTCYVGTSVAVHEFPEISNRLLQLRKAYVTSDNEAILLDGKPASVVAIPRPDLKVWRILLEEGSKTRVLQEVDGYLDTLKTMSGVSSAFLNQIVQDVLQIVYSYLDDMGIQAHQLFQDPVSVESLERSTHSVTDLKVWSDHLIDKAFRYAAELKESASVVDKVKAYITKHLEQELNRENIAASFFLHPDYINRLFKKETGMSMTEFLLHERLRMATELLEKTEQPVTVIAANIGYTNLSHFAKIFRKHTGLNPNEYRQSKRNEGKA
ncbi:response regulator transcription factor [Cohnella candidum]|uniref:Response regulator n=1 Tax=Cohnella candidum TaxID=2674991 RepID=A0A3G3JVL6_9BACL|nr:response regulator [Cohnella candidum]AYQ71549.1 response regulator [Cohnella candidum]